MEDGEERRFKSAEVEGVSVAAIVAKKSQNDGGGSGCYIVAHAMMGGSCGYSFSTAAQTHGSSHLLPFVRLTVVPLPGILRFKAYSSTQ